MVSDEPCDDVADARPWTGDDSREGCREAEKRVPWPVRPGFNFGWDERLLERVLYGEVIYSGMHAKAGMQTFIMG